MTEEKDVGGYVEALKRETDGEYVQRLALTYHISREQLARMSLRELHTYERAQIRESRTKRSETLKEDSRTALGKEIENVIRFSTQYG